MRKTTEQFITEATAKHGDLYSYEYSKYTKALDKVEIHCNTCNNAFWQKASNHLTGQGCPTCKGNGKRLTVLELQAALDDLYGETCTFDLSTYKSQQSYISLICNRCDRHYTKKVEKLLKRNQACTSCNRKAAGYKNRVTQNQFEARANKAHGDKFDYSKTVYITMHTPITIICNGCSQEFQQTPHNHLKGSGCPDCSRADQGWGSSRFRGKPTIFYVVSLGNSSYKVGITTRSVTSRYSGESVNIKILYQTTFLDGLDAWNLEKLVLQRLSTAKYSGPSLLTRTGTKEILTVNPVEYLQQLIKEIYEF